MNPWKLVLYYIILLACILFTFLCLIAQKYEFAIAIFGITIPYATIFMNQDFELKKIKINTISQNNIELYTKLSQNLNNLLSDLDCLNHNYSAFLIQEHLIKEQEEENDSKSFSDKTTINEIIACIDKCMKEFGIHLDDLNKFYNKNGISFSSCVDKQYQKLVNSKCIIYMTVRWSNSNFSDNKQYALKNFFEKSLKDIIGIRKDTNKLMKIMKKDLGVC